MNLFQIMLNKRAQQDEQAAKIATENRSAMRTLLQKAAEENNVDDIKALVDSARAVGVDPAPYMNIAGTLTEEQQTQRNFSKAMADALKQFTGMAQQTQPTPSFTPSPPVQPNVPAPDDDFATSPAMPQPPATPTAQPTRPAQQLLSPDFMKRAALKKFSGIDVREHYFEEPAWWETFGKLTKEGVPTSEALKQAAIKHKFIPYGASNLSDLPQYEKDALFERELSADLNNSTLDALIRKFIPANITGESYKKLKTGFILETKAGQDGYIPEHYRPLLDHFRDLDDTTKGVSNEIRERVLQQTGVPLEYHSDIPAAIANARKAQRAEALSQAIDEAYGTKSAQIQAEFDKELEKPINAEDRAKYGIGANFKTAAELADAGFRFPSSKEMELYNEYYTIRKQMADFHDSLFGTKEHPEYGIFSGIGNDWGSRTWAKKDLTKALAKGDQRGQNIQYYTDIIEALSRTLLRIANSGSSERPTDMDIYLIKHSAPETGGFSGIPDSETVAKRKYERYMMLVGAQLDRLLKTTTLGLSEKQPTAPPDDADAEMKRLIEEAQKNKGAKK